MSAVMYGVVVPWGHGAHGLSNSRDALFMCMAVVSLYSFFPTDMTHGWMPRGDLADPTVKEKVALGMTIGLAYFETLFDKSDS
jgi:hypothetical protein